MKTIIKQYLVLLCTLCVSMCFATAYGDNQTVFYESFNNCAGSGGNGGTFNPSSTSAIVYDNTGWSATGSVYGANQCARVGTSKNKGTLTTPALAYSGSNKLCLTFKAAPWNTETPQMTVTLNNGTISESADAASTAKNITLSAMTSGQWNEYTLYLSGVTTTTTITFSGSKNRFFLDEVKVEEIGSTPAPVKTLTSVALSGTPTHSTYTVGDSFDPTGLTVTATYSDNSTADVTSNATWQCDPATFTTAGTQTVTVMATVGNQSDIQEYSVSVTAPVTLNEVTLSGTLAKSIYEQYEAFDKTGLVVTAHYSDGTTADVTSSATWEFDPATFETAGRQSVLVSATYNGKTDLQEYSVNVTAASYLLAKLGTFTATNGTLNEDISYTSYQGHGTSGPTVENGNLKLYQASSADSYGGYITIKGGRGITLQQVTLWAVNATKVGYVKGEVNDENYPTSGQNVAAGASYTKSNLNCTEASFFCMSADKTERLLIDSIVVKYTKTAVALQSITLTVPEAVRRQRVNTEFTHEGVIVTAHYDDNSTEEVTDQATFSVPDMTAAGEKTVTVSYTENGVTKQASFTVEVYAPDYLFYESFNSCSGSGGNDGIWNNGGASVAYDNTGWTNQGNIYGANACVRVGTSGTLNWVKTPSIEFNGMAKLTFRAAPWTNDGTKLRVSVTEGKVSNNALGVGAAQYILLETVANQWTDFTLYLSEVESSTKILFESVNTSKNRFFLDEVKVVAYTPSPLSNIILSGAPTTTTYEVGDTFDRAGIVATAHFEDESEEIVTNSCTWTIEPETLNTAGTTNVSVTAAIGGKSATQSYQVTVTRKEASIAIDDLEVGVNGTVAIEATTTPEEAELTFQITEGEEVISIADGVITGLQVGTATVTAHFAGNDEYAPAETTFTVTVDAYQIASITEFEAVTGSFGTNGAISYDAFKGAGTTAPRVTKEKALLLYQGGGYVQLTATIGATIKQVTIHTTSSYNSTKVGVAVNDEEAPASTDANLVTVAKNSDYTVSSLSCESIRLYCLGGDKNSRLEISSITVKYEQAAGIELESLSVDVTNAQTEFVQNTTFNHTGALVTAHYTNGEEQDVTAQATFSTPDMNVTGETTVTVSYNGKTASYAIDIVPEVVTALTLGGNYPTRFHFGLDYIHTGMTVTATYNSGRTANVTEEAEYAEPDMFTPGRQTVTISYGGQEVTYQILVLDPAVVFYESFDLCNGKGANDGEWERSIGSGTTKTDNEGWEFAKDGGAYQCLKLGTTGAAGSATTPAFSLRADDSYVLTFRAAAWLSDETNKSITLTATNAELSTTTIELENGVWNNYTVAIRNVQGAVKITFASVTDGANRFFLDEVKVSNGYQRAIDLTGVSNKWGTICLNQRVAPEERSGAQFYNVAAVIVEGAPVVVGSPDNRALARGGFGQVVGILLEEETDTLEAGKPYIFNAYAPTLVCAFHGLDYAAEAIPATGLVGNLTGTDMTVEDGNYLLGNNQFHLVNGADAYIGNNRAYISLNGVPAVLPSTEMAANQVRFFLDGTIEGDYTTAIEGIEQTAQANGTVFNLQGQRTDELQRGQLYIRNGKTFVVK